MPNVLSEYGSILERSTFYVVIYQTASTETHYLFGYKYSQPPLTTVSHR